jgi:FkbM family methyltransferase
VTASEELVQVHDRHWIKVDSIDSLALRAQSGVFEPDEVDVCKKLIQPGDRVLDVGANIGFYTLLFADLVGESGKVVAVEPDIGNYELLAENLQRQVNSRVVELRRLALGREPGKASLFRAIDNAGMHRMYPSVCCAGESLEVEVVTGDSLQLAPLNFIKIDIEGYEPIAFEGLQATLRSSPELKILCEFSPLSIFEAGASPVAFLEQMAAHGFSAFGLGAGRWSEINLNAMISALSQISSNALQELAGALQSSEGNQSIEQKASHFLATHGYKRPMLENLLFVSPKAHSFVTNRLSAAGNSPSSSFINRLAGFFRAKSAD